MCCSTLLLSAQSASERRLLRCAGGRQMPLGSRQVGARRACVCAERVRRAVDVGWRVGERDDRARARGQPGASQIATRRVIPRALFARYSGACLTRWN